MTTKIKPAATSETATDADSAESTCEVMETALVVAGPHDPAALRQRRESLGVSRRVLAELTGLSESRCWASEQPDREVAGEHLALIGKCLDDVQANGLPAHLKPTAAKAVGGGGASAAKRVVALARRLHDVAELLGQAQETKNVKDLRALVERALAVAAGSNGDAEAEETAGDSPQFELVPEAAQAPDAAQTVQAG